MDFFIVVIFACGDDLWCHTYDSCVCVCVRVCVHVTCERDGVD